MCAFRIVVYNPFFVTSNNFPQKVLLALPGKQRDVFVEPAANAVFGEYMVCNRFSLNNNFKTSVFDVCGVPECCQSLRSKSPALKRRNRYLQVMWDKKPSPSTEHIDFSILPLLELVENTVSNMQFLVAHLVKKVYLDTKVIFPPDGNIPATPQSLLDTAVFHLSKQSGAMASESLWPCGSLALENFCISNGFDPKKIHLRLVSLNF
uniref:DZF domain-containing protein n=1 Tax=Heterorhabditis bacteriophora TaxID=37862 RepID=A0A1I7WYE5_HETBA